VVLNISRFGEVLLFLCSKDLGVASLWNYEIDSIEQLFLQFIRLIYRIEKGRYFTIKKLLCIVLGLIFLIITGCSNSSGNDEGTAVKYAKTQGYEIITQNGEIQKYTLEKSKLYGSTETLPYQQLWAVQKVEPDKYFGKEITIYGFTVKNHPLENIYKVKANIYIMLSDGKVVGGYSFPDEQMDGSVYSLDGKTLEEVTGLSYQQWRKNWEKKYSN
jgi:uncharacterized membrane protein YcgQ (UPF0703/DUF1980 family)